MAVHRLLPPLLLLSAAPIGARAAYHRWQDHLLREDVPLVVLYSVDSYSVERMCVTADEGAKKVRVEACDDARSDQRWTLKGGALKSKGGLCLTSTERCKTVYWFSTDVVCDVDLSACNDAPAQAWEVQQDDDDPWEPGSSFHVRHTDRKVSSVLRRCLYVPPPSASGGGGILLSAMTCNFARTEHARRQVLYVKDGVPS